MSNNKLKRPSLHYPMVPVYELLRKTAERPPQKIAIVDPLAQKALSFRQLNRLSDALAQIL